MIEDEIRDEEELEDEEEQDEDEDENEDVEAKAEAAAQSYVVSEEIIETTWECARCHAKNPGSSMRCDSCGSPKTADAAYTVSEDGPAVTDAAQLADAAAGFHWVCPYCDGQNRGNVPQCSSCGATVDPKDRKIAKEDAAALAAASGESAPEAAPGPKKKSPVLFIVLGIVVLLLGIFALSQCGSEDLVKVESMSWQRDITIEEKHIENKEGWKKDIKKEAYDLRCYKKVSGHKKVKEERRDSSGQVVTQQKCEEKVENLNNGYAKKVKECKDVPVFDEKEVEVESDFCSYKLDNWRELKKFTAKGDGIENIVWPEVEDVSSFNETRKVPREIYNVNILTSEENKLVYKAKTVDEYKKYVVGKEYTAQISNFGKTVDKLEDIQ